MTQTTGPATSQRIAEIVAEGLPKCKTVEDLLGFTICIVADEVCALARKHGVENPNSEAVREAATDAILKTWRRDMPNLWNDYCREIGAIDEHPDGDGQPEGA